MKIELGKIYQTKNGEWLVTPLHRRATTDRFPWICLVKIPVEGIEVSATYSDTGCYFSGPSSFDLALEPTTSPEIPNPSKL